MGGHGSLVHGRGTYWLRKVRAPGVSTRCSQGPLGDRGVEDDHPEVAEVASLSLGGWVICGVGVDRALVPGRRVADDWVEGHAHAGDAGGVEMGGPVRHGQKHGRRDQDAGAELRGPADRPPVDRADVGVPGAVGGTADDGASRGGEDGQGQRGKGDRPGDQSAGSCCPPFGGGGCESSWSSCRAPLSAVDVQDVDAAAETDDRPTTTAASISIWRVSPLLRQAGALCPQGRPRRASQRRTASR